MIVLNGQPTPLKQPNSGDKDGTLFATYNIDLKTNKGRIRIGEGVRQALTNSDDVDFDGYAAAIVNYGGATGDLFAVSDKVFTTNAETPTADWAEASTSGDEPDSGNTVMDGVVFDSLLLVSLPTEITAWNGSTWSDNWASLSLSSGHRHLMRVGADGNLYIVDNGNKLVKVTPAGSVTTSGAGVLDFSATPHIFQCIETSSSRFWIGTKNAGGEAVIIEWDMGAQTTSANRIHKIGAEAVWCIAIWNDTPIAILSNGKVKYHNGASFVDLPGVQLPIGDKILQDEFVHPNGWAIIDDLPHFLIKGSPELDESQYLETTSNSWNFPSGVWCLDPEIGLYHRFHIGAGADTQFDNGQPSIKAVGALHALKSPSTKFLCSYEYSVDDATSMSVLAYHDAAKTKPVSGFFATVPLDTFNDPFKTVKSIFKKLGEGDRIDLYYRTHELPSVRLAGVWASTSQFNTTDDASEVEDGWVALIKQGSGAGQIARIREKGSSVATYSIAFDADVPHAVAESDAVIECLNFKKLGTIEGGSDWKQLSIPNSENVRRVQLLVVIHQAAGNTQEMDYVIINK